MATLASIIGQDVALRTIRSTIRSGKPASAYLFVGPAGVGKHTTALVFAQALLCKHIADNTEPCGICNSCQKISTDVHPDILSLEPTIHKDRKKKEITIGDMRQLIGIIAMKPYESDRKVVLIEGCDLMNLNAANAFLKTLEEPPERTVIILMVQNLLSMPATIVSRCQTIRFFPLPPKTIAQLLRDRGSVSDEEAVVIASLAGGSPGAAISGAWEEERESRDIALELLRHIGNGRAVGMLKIAESLDRGSDRDKVDRTLEALLTLIRDLVTVKIGSKCDTLINMDLQSELTMLSRQFSRRRLLGAFDSTTEALADRLWNINPLLTVSLLCLEMRK